MDLILENFDIPALMVIMEFFELKKALNNNLSF